MMFRINLEGGREPSNTPLFEPMEVGKEAEREEKEEKEVEKGEEEKEEEEDRGGGRRKRRKWEKFSW